MEHPGLKPYSVDELVAVLKRGKMYLARSHLRNVYELHAVETDEVAYGLPDVIVDEAVAQGLIIQRRSAKIWTEYRVVWPGQFIE